VQGVERSDAIVTVGGLRRHLCLERLVLQAVQQDVNEEVQAQNVAEDDEATQWVLPQNAYKLQWGEGREAGSASSSSAVNTGPDAFAWQSPATSCCTGIVLPSMCAGKAHTHALAAKPCQTKNAGSPAPP
jgi:hypothetical protein